MFVSSLILVLTPAPAAEAADAGRYRGVDASFLSQYESAGVTFRAKGRPIDPLEAFAKSGVNLLRLRVWVDPASGWSGLDDALALARRARDAEMGVLLNLHYSDAWADPGQQTIPGAWSGLEGPALADRVRDYSRDTVSAFVAQGTPPVMVQVGNEVTDGMLWPHGRISVRGWDAFAELLTAGIAGVREGAGAHAVRVMVHTDRGADAPTADWFYSNLDARAIDYDVIGLSYYPWWHGTIEAMTLNVRALAAEFGRELMIVETAYPWTLAWNDDTFNLVGDPAQLLPNFAATPGGQRAFFERVEQAVQRTPGGLGVCYWAPVHVGGPGVGSPWENLAWFDFAGELLPIGAPVEPKDRSGVSVR